MNELYIVTGAAGHLGTAVIKKLKELDKDIRVLVLKGEKNVPNGVEVVFGDVCDKKSLEPLFDNEEKRELIVIHLAGIVSIASKYIQKVVDVNVGGTKNIIDMCKKHNVKKLVYISSVHAIKERPKGEIICETDEFSSEAVVGLYAKTKAEATRLVLEAAKEGLNASVVHPSGICGPYDDGHGHITTLVIDYVKRRLTASINGGYDFVDVRDVANGIVSCSQNGKKGECYILSNKYFTLKEILFMLHEITGQKEIKTILPMWFAKITAPLAETYYKILKQPPLYTSYSLYTVGSNAVFSHEKATNELGYTTRDMKETLKDTVDYLKKQGRI